VRLRTTLIIGLAAFAVLFGGQLVRAEPAAASPSIRYGIQDDAWLAYGPGTLSERVERLRELGVGIVRFTLPWNEIAPTRPADPSDPDDPAYEWSPYEAVLKELRAARIETVLTIVGAPRWANGGQTSNWAPRVSGSFGAFASAAATQFPWVKRWLIWNEPNQRRWLRPASASTYVRTLLNPAYAAIHDVTPDALVAGGVTAPRGGSGGVSPVAFIRGMWVAGARLDAYAHHPYPLRPDETPSAGGCDHCETITMATLGRLDREVTRAWGDKRIWLTEYAYQTNPPDRFLGVSYALQSRYLADAALRAYLAPKVDMLIHYLVVDEPDIGRWQSGLYTVGGREKPALQSFCVPFAQMSRRGSQTTVWGQVRTGSGRRVYRLQRLSGGTWRSVGPARRTDARGYLRLTVTAPAGTKLRVTAESAHASSPVLVVR
jgi:hypothetical protein